MLEEYTQNIHTYNQLGNLNQEKIPERLTHAKGTGAHGYFKVTQDLTYFTQANFLSSIGKLTPVFVRFSNYRGEKGSPDSLRDPRGMAIKFYTEEGNFDLTANSIPVFFIRDPQKFPDFVHSQKRNSKTNLFDKNQTWKFYLQNPETFHALLFTYSERGIPANYRQMHAYACHAYRFYRGDNSVFVKFHIKTKQGIKNLSIEDAEELAGKEPDFYTKDLYEAIEEKDFPRWTVYIQILKEEEIPKLNFDPFDPTKVWPTKNFPLLELGILELNRNPINYFSEVEQAAFSPASLVLGIGVSPDPLLLARLFSYSDAQRYRLGVNYNQLPINRQVCPFHSKHRDGFMQMEINSDRESNSINNLFSNSKEKLYQFKTSYKFPIDDISQPKSFLKILSQNSKTYLQNELQKEIQTLSCEVQKEAFEKLCFVFEKEENLVLG
jgi:catalase